MEDLYFKLLERGVNSGLFNSVEVSDLFRNYFRENNYNKPEIPYNWWCLAYEMLDPIAAKEYIHYIRLEPPNKDNPTENWIDEIRVIITLHPEGLLFYNSWNQMKVQEQANKLSRRNIIATLVLTGVGFLIATGTFIKSFFNEYDNKPHMQPLSQQLHQQNRTDSMSLKKLNQIPYPPEKSRK